MTATLLVGDVFDRMAGLDDHSFDLILTSPPFLALRSYLPHDHPDKAKEIGSEATPAEFLDTMLALTAEWRRLLAPHGSIAIELGDTYAGSGGAGGDYGPDGLRDGQPKFRQVASREHRPEREGTGADGGERVVPLNGGSGWPLDKSLCGIPTLYTWSLAYGRNLLTGAESPAGRWRIRNLKVWIRTNPPVGALGDKERPATSYITVACVSSGRWFDLDAVRSPNSRVDEPGQTGPKANGSGRLGGDSPQNPGGAPPLDWWHQTDAVIDHELQVGWSDRGCPVTPHMYNDEEPQTSDGNSHSVSQRRRPTGASMPTLGGVDPTRAASAAPPPSVDNPDRWHQTDALIDKVLQDRAGKSNGGRGARVGQSSAHSNYKGDQNQPDRERDPGGSTVGARGHHIRRALEAAGILPPHPDALDISPKGYAGAHYAVWPPELVRQLVDEMCPRRVCTTCGQPSRRIVNNVAMLDGQPLTRSVDASARDKGAAHGFNHNRLSTDRQTVGWSDCGHNTWRPGRILDPFSGSGTTLATAHNMGRDAVGIDIDQASYGMTAGRLGPLITAIEFHIEWPAPNWDALTLPRGGGDYTPWAHLTDGVPTTTRTPTTTPPRRPTVDHPGQGTLL